MSFSLIENVSLLLVGLLLISSYYYFGSISTMKNIEELWGGIEGGLRTYYIVSIFLCAAAFTLLFIYVNSSQKISSSVKHCLYISMMSIALISLYWMPLSMFYLKKKDIFIKLLILFTLFIISLSAFFILYELNKIEDSSILYKFTFYSMCYFFFHVTALDFIIWSMQFFSLEE